MRPKDYAPQVGDVVEWPNSILHTRCRGRVTKISEEGISVGDNNAKGTDGFWRPYGFDATIAPDAIVALIGADGEKKWDT